MRNDVIRTEFFWVGERHYFSTVCFTDVAREVKSVTSNPIMMPLLLFRRESMIAWNRVVTVGKDK